MDLTSFLARVLPDDGYFVLAYKPTKSNRGLKHEVFTTADELSNRALELRSANDVWFACASMKDRTYTTSDGRVRGPRNQKNFQECRVLFSDLDVGPDKAYKTQDEAIQDLGRFLKATGIKPPTLIVSSGSGLHVYWVLERCLTIAEWQPLADGLKKYCLAHDFHIDPAVTGDGARILRPPETFNHKTGTPQEVKVLRDTGTILGIDETRRKFAAFRLTSVEGDASANEELKTKFTGQSGPHLASRIFERCPYLGWVRDTGGREPQEPEWMGVLHLLSFCDDGREHIHEVSKEFITYTKHETERKFTARFQVDREKYKPTLCETFHSHQMARSGNSFCDTCPHNGSIKSPISLGSERDRTMPPGFELKDGLLYERVEVEEGEFVSQLVMPYRMSNFRLVLYDEDIGNREENADELAVDVEYQGKKWTARIKTSAFTQAATFEAQLLRSHMFGQDSEIKSMRRFMKGFLQTIQSQKTYVKTGYTTFGWHQYDDKPAFGLSNSMYTKEGEISEALKVSPAMVQDYRTGGDPKPWTAVAQTLISQPDQSAAIVLAASFAAPLVQISGGRGYLISAYSDDTGTGKTTALKTALAAWGNPITAMQSVNDTENAVADTLARAANVPLFWDELRTKRNEDMFVKFVFSMFEGREKRRMTRQLETMGGRAWQTILVCGTNTSITDILKRNNTGMAGAARTFEIGFETPSQTLKVGTHELSGLKLNRFLKLPEYNYGFAGREFIKRLLNEYESVPGQIDAVTSRWTDKFQQDAEGRFHVEATGLLLAAACLVNRYGILKFDIQRLAQALADKVIAKHEEKEEEKKETKTVEAYIKAFMEAMEDETLVTNQLARAGRHQNVTVIRPPKSGRIAVQTESEGTEVLLSKRRLREWLYNSRENYTTIRRRMKTRPWFLREVSRSFGGRTEYQGPPRDAFLIDWKILDSTP